jgi:hypothetical protein
VGRITFEDIGPYDLPEATHADAQANGDRVMLSFRLWKSDKEWTLVRAFVPNDQARELHRKLWDLFVKSDGQTVI